MTIIHTCTLCSTMDKSTGDELPEGWAYRTIFEVICTICAGCAACLDNQ